MSSPSMTQVGVKQLAPLLMVWSMGASLRFYVDGLGFTLTNTWKPDGKIRWCWLELGEAALMLQEWSADDPRRADLKGKIGEGVGFYFICEDALAFYHAVKDRGLEVQRPFVGNHMWVTSLDDPDGWSLHFESPTAVAEGTVYDR
ncbi:MAG: VOC family protein [Gemmatimonadales bacterium]